uniref:3'-5' exonuclease domain-containing protein n=1 Tax=Hyaloperonospora arabidopsidis (strain Emoy2) TaxID=559515 RepID=M4BTP9_HYAAE
MKNKSVLASRALRKRISRVEKTGRSRISKKVTRDSIWRRMRSIKRIGQRIRPSSRLPSDTASFASKQELLTTKSTALISPAGQKQRQQLNRLRAALTNETVALSPPVSSRHSIPMVEITAGNPECAMAKKRQKEFARMLRLKKARHARVKDLPLFREGSFLFRHFGAKTLEDYDHLPGFVFEGEIAVIHSEIEEEQYVEYLRDQKVVGVDTEARPDFSPLKGKKGNPVCLIQVCTLERAFLYRLQRGKPLPPMLQELFADPDVLKVGHSLSDDCRHLKVLGLVQAVNSTVDTLYITQKLGCMRPGLKTACQVFLRVSLDKEMQVSDWEAPVLSQAQINYAATDAWAPMRDENHEVLLGKLLSFALRHQVPKLEYELHSSK